MKVKNTDIIKAFAFEKTPRLLIQLIYICVFALVLYLCDAPLHGIVYAVLICATAELALLAINYYRFSKKHKDLAEQIDYIKISCNELPKPSGMIERDYANLLRTVCNDRTEILLKNDREKCDMIDYYTIWAHQIKTPISAMHLILQNEESSIGRALSTELFRTEQYVDMVLAYLRIGSESSDYVIEQYRLDKIVKQAVRKYSPLFIYKKITLNLAPIDAKIITDEKWLCFVIEQIISNAIKYTRSGSISIHAESCDSKTSLIIEDTGIGISADDLPRVFDKGFTGYNGRLDKKATGIGLYLSKKILDKLNHEISIESKSGIGTIVRIDFNSSADYCVE